MGHIGAISQLTALLAIASGRHFLGSSLPVREREALSAALTLYLVFGVVTELCDGEVLFQLPGCFFCTLQLFAQLRFAAITAQPRNQGAVDRVWWARA